MAEWRNFLPSLLAFQAVDNNYVVRYFYDPTNKTKPFHSLRGKLKSWTQADKVLQATQNLQAQTPSKKVASQPKSAGKKPKRPLPRAEKDAPQPSKKICKGKNSAPT